MDKIRVKNPIIAPNTPSLTTTQFLDALDRKLKKRMSAREMILA